MAWFRRRRVVDDTAPPVRQRTDVVEEEVPPPPRPPLIWPWLLLLILLLLAGLGAWWFLSREDDKRTVPELVGLQERVAVQRVEAEDLQAEVDRRANERPSGVVFAQTPGGGAQVDEGEVIELEVSTGPARVVVPQVVNEPQEQAEAELRDAGFEVLVRRVFHEDEPGTVVAQDPEGGERAERDSTVRINVSAGTGRVTVPDIVGVTREVAEQRLRRAGLTARVFEVPAPDPPGTVVAQNPVPGKELARGDTVRINVSTGESPPATGTTKDTTAGTTTAGGGGAPPPARVAVPTVVGQSQTAAQNRLQAAGFGVTVDFVPSREPEGRVVSQNPVAGAQGRRGSFVHINVSEGPQTRPRRAVPDVVGLDEQTARQDLQRAGFRVQVFREATPDPGEEGIVLRQEPSAGRMAARGALITLYVGELTG